MRAASTEARERLKAAMLRLAAGVSTDKAGGAVVLR